MAKITIYMAFEAWVSLCACFGTLSTSLKEAASARAPVVFYAFIEDILLQFHLNNTQINTAQQLLYITLALIGHKEWYNNRPYKPGLVSIGRCVQLAMKYFCGRFAQH